MKRKSKEHRKKLSKDTVKYKRQRHSTSSASACPELESPESEAKVQNSGTSSPLQTKFKSELFTQNIEKDTERSPESDKVMAEQTTRVAPIPDANNVSISD